MPRKLNLKLRQTGWKLVRVYVVLNVEYTQMYDKYIDRAVKTQ